MKKRSLFSFFVLLSLILFLIPVIVYNYFRIFGGLHSKLGWAAIESTNKGPWVSTWQGLTMYLPMLATMLFVVVGLFLVFRLQVRDGLKYLAGAALQYIFTYGLLDSIMWTVSS